MSSASCISLLHRLVLACSLLPSVVVGQFFFHDTTFISIRDTATFDVDLNTVPNKVILLTGTNTNLALKKGIAVKYADPTRVSNHQTAWNPALMIDGELAGNSFFELLDRQEGSQIRIDLQAVRIVNNLRMQTFPRNNTTFRIRGYSIYLGLDSVFYKKVKQVADNELANTNDFFDPDTARYVLITVDKQDPSLTNPLSTTIGEIEVFGTGYLSTGSFISIPRDAGQAMNWGRVSWSGLTPQGTSITMQVRTGNSPTPDATWSPWSDEVRTPNSLFDVFEPRRYFQYRANLYTFSTETPLLENVTVTYDVQLVMSAATAQVNPRTASILQETQVEYQITTQADARSTGIDTLVIFTDLPLAVPGVTVDNISVNFQTFFKAGQVVIGFGSTITTNSVISVSLKFTPFLIEHRFPAIIISKQNPANPQRVDFTRLQGVESWILTATGVPEELIVSATADPNPFTPNGDGLNDVTKFSFFVSNLVVPRPLRLNIYDVTGRKVRTVLDLNSTANAFVEQNSIPWDGRDDGGKLLPPGLYIYQIIVEADGVNPTAITKTVTIAY